MKKLAWFVVLVFQFVVLAASGGSPGLPRPRSRARSSMRARARFPASRSRCATTHRRRCRRAPRIPRGATSSTSSIPAPTPSSRSCRASAPSSSVYVAGVAARRRHRRPLDRASAASKRASSWPARRWRCSSTPSSERVHAAERAHRPGAAQRPQPLQPRQPRSDDVQHAGDHRAGEPAVPPRVRQRLRRRRRHPTRQRRAARRRAARRQLQDLVHAVDGRGRGDHHLEEQRGRRERPQPRRRDQPEHEVGHQPVPRLGLLLRPQPAASTRLPIRPCAACRAAATRPACTAPSCRCTAARSAARSGEQDVLLLVVRAVGRQQAADDRPDRADRARAPRRLQPVGAERPRAHHLRPVLVDAGLPPAASSARRLPAT